MLQSLLVSAFLKETKISLSLILTKNPTDGSFYFPWYLLPVISILLYLICGCLLMVSILKQSAIYLSLLYVCKGKDASMCDSRGPWLELLGLASEASKFSHIKVYEMKRNVLIPIDIYSSRRVQCPKELCKLRTATEIKTYKDIQNLCTTKRNPS